MRATVCRKMAARMRHANVAVAAVQLLPKAPGLIRVAHPTCNRDFSVTPVLGAPVTAYIGLGANLGDAPAAVRTAMDAIARLPGVKETARSSLYGSAPVDADGSDYVNAVMQVQTTLSAHQLLAGLQSLEHGAGRTRSYRNAPRTLDLDVLLYGDEVIDTPDLAVPHPRMWTRAFVLQPLAELDQHLVSDMHLNLVANQRVWRLI